MSEYPGVDVLICTYNEAVHVRRCLEAVLSQDYPVDRLTAWVIDGGSTDGTQEILREAARSDPRIKLIGDGRRLTLPEALAIGLSESSGEYVAKIDAHGYPERDYVRRAVEHFREGPGELGCVGGRPLQEGETLFGEAIALARTSRFGVGASEYAGTSSAGYVESVQCGIYRRDALVWVGGFDTAMNYGEDEEANWRLRAGGFKILLDTRIVFHYYTRSSWRSAFRQYKNYGYARIAVVRKHPSFLRPHHLAPAALVASIPLLGVLSVFSTPARIASGTLFVGYAVGLLGAAALAARDRRELGTRVAAAFTALHLGYGIGILAGLGKIVGRARRVRQKQLRPNCLPAEPC